MLVLEGSRQPGNEGTRVVNDKAVVRQRRKQRGGKVTMQICFQLWMKAARCCGGEFVRFTRNGNSGREQKKG